MIKKLKEMKEQDKILRVPKIVWLVTLIPLGLYELFALVMKFGFDTPGLTLSEGYWDSASNFNQLDMLAASFGGWLIYHFIKGRTKRTPKE